MKTRLKNLNSVISIVLFSLVFFGLSVASSADITPVSERTTEVQTAIVEAAAVDSAADVTETHLAAVTTLDLRAKGITALKSGDFSGMSGLTNINLYDNQLSSLPDGIFDGLTALTSLRLGRNTVDPFPITVTLEKVGENEFKAVVPTGAPFEIVVPVSVSNGSINTDANTLTIAKGSRDSGTLTVSQTIDRISVIVDFSSLPNLPQNHYGYMLSKSETVPTEVIIGNTAPMFVEGSSATRSIVENTETDVNIGTPIAATDTEDDPLTYTLGGIDASAFSIDSESGQLKTKTSLDYETKPLYSITITTSDGLLTDTITVTVNVIDLIDNPAPQFTEGAITVRKIAENSEAEVNIGTPVVAIDITEKTDKDNAADTLTYTLAGIDAATFSINSNTGQLKTKEALDFGKKSLYKVTITVTDGDLSDIITVVIQVIDLAETAFVSEFLPLNERTQQVQDQIVDIVSEDEISEAHIAAITSLNLRDTGITELQSTDFSGMSSLTDINLYDNMLTALPIGIFQGLTSLTTLRLGNNLLDPLPIFVSLQQVEKNVFQVYVPSGAPFDIVVPIQVANGHISSGVSTATVLTGTLTSQPFTIVPTTDTLTPASVSIGPLPGLPLNHYGYILTRSTACYRTPEVVSAIEAMYPFLMHCQNVANVDIATITFLNLDEMRIVSLRTDDFSGFLSLTTLYLNNNTLTDLPAEIFAGLDALDTIYFRGNRLALLPDGIFKGLTNLESLDLSGNAIDPLPLTVLLEKVDESAFKAVVPTGAPFDIVLNVVANNANTADGIGSITIPKGSVESDVYTLTRRPNTFNAVSVDISTLPSLPSLHTGYELVKSDTLPLEILSRIEVAPVITEGANTTRSVAENTVAGINIGDAITATDGNNDILTYNLSGADAAVFDIDSTTGQLKTNSALDHETKGTYSVEVIASDGDLSTSIQVSITVTDVNDPPIFAVESVTYSIPENTPIGHVFGSEVTLTDQDDTRESLSITLTGSDASGFSIADGIVGKFVVQQSFDYETQSVFNVTIRVEDSSGATDTLPVEIRIIDIDVNATNNAPVFTAGASATREIAENTDANTDIGLPFSASDPDGDTLRYSLGGTDAASFSIVTTTEQTVQLRTNSALDHETKGTYSVEVIASDGDLSTSIQVSITVTDVNDPPVFAVESVTYSIPENTPIGHIFGSVVTLTDQDDTSLSITLTDSDSSAFSIADGNIGKFKTKQAFDFGTKSVFRVTIWAEDSSGATDTLPVVIRITNIDENVNNAPVFTAGASATREIAENTDANTYIGLPFSASDPDGDTLSYSLGGTDAASFSIVTTTEQTVQLKTKNALDHETKGTYSVEVIASDGDLSSSIQVSITVTDVNDPPVFAVESITYSIRENTPIGTIFGSEVTLTDQDDTRESLSITLTGSDSSTFSIADGNIGKFETQQAFDYETKSVFRVTIRAEDSNGATDTLPVVIRIIDIVESTANKAPVFTEGTTATRTVPINTDTGRNIGLPIAATDANQNNLTYTLGGTDGLSFDIVRTTGQLQTKGTTYCDKKSYSVTIRVSDGKLSDSIVVTINVNEVNVRENNRDPMFTVPGPYTMSIPENTPAGVNIGNPITTSDPDNDCLEYVIDGVGKELFDIDPRSGQFRTKSPLDYEIKNSYSLTLWISDFGLIVSTGVTIDITDVNDPPVFAVDSLTYTIPENTPIGTIFGSEVTLTDQDDTRESLSITLTGSDSSAFSIADGIVGKFETQQAFDFGTKSVFRVTIRAEDSSGATDTLPVVIRITNIDENVNNAPVFTGGASATREIAENTDANTDIGLPFSASDPDSDPLSYSLGGTDAASFSIVTTSEQSGQLKTKNALDHETKGTYSVEVIASDGELSTSIQVTITVTDVNDPPVFPVESVTYSIPENTTSGQIVGTPVLATDQDGDFVLYVESGPNEDWNGFTLNTHTGQLLTRISSYDFETKPTYTLTITARDRHSATDTLAVTINITEAVNGANRAPTAVGSIPAQTMQSDDSALLLTVSSYFTDPDGDNLTYTASSSNSGVATASVSGAQVSISAVAVGTATITVTANDESLSVTQTISVTVTAATVELTYPVSGRTQQVQDAIVAAVDGIDSAADVTATHLAAITELNLEDESISSLKTGDFEGLTALTSLFLGDNSISDISVVSGLTKLTHLSLEDNSISDISVISGLTSLTWLSLSGNSISDISAVSGLTTLTSLFLSGNSISDISAVSGLTSLTELWLGGNSIIDISAVSGLTKLTWLSLSGNSISDFAPLRTLIAAIEADNRSLELDITIPAATLLSGRTQQVQDAIVAAVDGIDSAADITEIHLAAISELDLSNESISSLKSGDFGGLTALMWLDLGRNSISDISPLSGLTVLTVLNLGRNSISDISPLSGLTKLIGLDLGRNSISNISALSGLTKLTQLYLNGNSISDVSPLEGLTSLTTLRLNGNSISDYSPLRTLVAAIEADNRSLELDITIPAPTLLSGRTQQVQTAILAAVDGIDSASDVTATHLAAITELDLNFKSISSLKSGDFAGLTALTSLDLAENSFSDISALSGLTTLTKLFLGNNSISNISAVSGLTNLTELDLYDNSISNISSVSGLTKLTKLYLDGNSISDISAVSGLTVLKELYLDNNSISDVSPLEGLTSLRTLRLSGNSISDYAPLGRLVAAIKAAGGSLDLDITILVSVPVSGRTQQVQDAIVAAVDGIDSAEDVTVTHLAAITELDLNDKSISALKSGDFEGLTSLISLDLADNSISDISSISGLTTLTSLDLGDNSIIDISAVSGLTALTSLDLYENSIINISAVSGLTSLTWLSLDENSISDISSVSELTKLTRLFLDSNSISDVSPLEGLTSLNTLYLSGNSISNYVPLRTLVAAIEADDRTLTLDITIPIFVPVSERTQQVQDAIVAAVDGINSASDVTETHLAAITELDLFDKSISSLKSGDFNNLTVLTTLDLEGNSISDISAVSGLTTLTELWLDVNSISDISAVSGLTKLTELGLSVNSISDISAVSGLTVLKELYLGNNHSISDISALSGLTKLTELSMFGNSISDISAVSGLTALIELDLNQNSISDISALSGLTKLTGLNLYENSISNVSPLEGLTSLEYLFLSDNPISDYAPLRRLVAAIEADNRTLELDIIIPSTGAPSITNPPIQTSLLPNYPNPFNPETWIPYQLAKPSDVTLTIYNVRGVLVRELALGHRAAGVYYSRPRAAHWDGKNNLGEKVAGGVYFVKFKAGNYTKIRKMLIRK